MQEAKIGNDNALKYKTAEELGNAIKNYFKECDDKEKPYTVSGLALSLGVDRSTLIRYNEKSSYATLIKNAKLKIENQLEESLYRLGNNSGVIFNLKNNYGWKDTVEVESKPLQKVEELLNKIEEEANK